MTLIKRLKTAKKPILLYGMGNGADQIIKRLYENGISISGVFVSDGFVRDKTFHGFKLCSYSEAKARFGDMIVLLAFGSNLPDVIANIVAISKEQELYAPYIPVVSGSDFTEEYYINHKKDFEFVKSNFSDELSVSIYDDIISYRLSGEIDYLLRSASSQDEIYDLLSLNGGEVYVDLGAYKGETVKEFIKYAGSYKHIYALEPDSKNFKKLKENLCDLPDTTLLNAAIYSETKPLSFAMAGARSSKISDDGAKVQGISVDDMLEGQKASYIKFDVEGAELSAILGAEKTITKYKPKLAISCYHKTDDLFEIPKIVLKMNPDYKMYIRHIRYIPDWDTLFYFV